MPMLEAGSPTPLTRQRDNGARPLEWMNLADERLSGGWRSIVPLVAAALVLGWLHICGAFAGDGQATHELLALTPALLGIIGVRPSTQNAASAAVAEGVTAREIDPGEWDQLLEQFPHHSVFHTRPWLSTIQAVHKARTRLIAAEDDQGRCIAIWPVFETRKGPLRILGSPLPGWSTAYMGPLFADEQHVPGALEALMSHPVFTRCSYFATKVFNDRYPVDLGPFGFKNVLNFETYCLDLKPSDDALWDNLKSECRTQIRKARKLGIEVRQETDDAFIEPFWTMSVETFSVCSMQPTFTKPFLREMWQRLSKADSVRVYSAWHEGERIAALVLPFDQHTMYYFVGGSYTRCRRLPAHNLLHWEAITAAKRMGLSRYDFVSTLGGAGRFKKTFGPECVHIATHWERSSSRLIQAIKDQYERYLMRRMKIKG